MKMVQLKCDSQSSDTRSRYGVELDEDGNVKSFNRKLNYRPQKSDTSTFGLESFR